MSQHKIMVMNLAMNNGEPDRDTFVLLHDVSNLANKRAGELWQKHHNDIVSVRMWKEEYEGIVFYYQEHGMLNLNNTKQDETPNRMRYHLPSESRQRGSSNASYNLDMEMRFRLMRHLAQVNPRKNWNENAVQKIGRIEDQAYVLKQIGDIMYSRGLPSMLIQVHGLTLDSML